MAEFKELHLPVLDEHSKPLPIDQTLFYKRHRTPADANGDRSLFIAGYPSDRRSVALLKSLIVNICGGIAGIVEDGTKAHLVLKKSNVQKLEDLSVGQINEKARKIKLPETTLGLEGVIDVGTL